MKILYVYQFFKTPDEGGIIRSYYLAQALAEAGHEVEVLTSHARPGYARRRVGSLTVHYLPVAYAQQFGFARRVGAYLRFALLALWHARKISGLERVYAASVPLTVGLTALGMKWLRGIPYFFEVGDLWPQTPIEMGVIRNRLLQNLLYAFERLVYRQADKIVVLSPAIQASIEGRGGQGKTVNIPNLADCAFFRPPAGPRPEARHGTGGRLVVTYFGAMGRANGLEALLEVARHSQHVADPVFFLLVGDGSERPRLRQLAESYGLQNLRFIDPVGKAELRTILAETDLVYVSFLPLPVLQTNSPNKLFDALAAGKPVVMNLPGWHTTLLEARRCGWYADPARPADFSEKIQPYLADPARLDASGRAARQLALEAFDRPLLARQFVALFGPASRFQPASAALSSPN